MDAAARLHGLTLGYHLLLLPAVQPGAGGWCMLMRQAMLGRHALPRGGASLGVGFHGHRHSDTIKWGELISAAGAAGPVGHAAEGGSWRAAGRVSASVVVGGGVQCQPELWPSLPWIDMLCQCAGFGILRERVQNKFALPDTVRGNVAITQQETGA